MADDTLLTRETLPAPGAVTGELVAFPVPPRARPVLSDGRRAWLRRADGQLDQIGGDRAG